MYFEFYVKSRTFSLEMCYDKLAGLINKITKWLTINVTS